MFWNSPYWISYKHENGLFYLVCFFYLVKNYHMCYNHFITGYMVCRHLVRTNNLLLRSRKNDMLGASSDEDNWDKLCYHVVTSSFYRYKILIVYQSNCTSYIISISQNNLPSIIQRLYMWVMYCSLSHCRTE